MEGSHFRVASGERRAQEDNERNRKLDILKTLFKDIYAEMLICFLAKRPQFSCATTLRRFVNFPL